VVLGLLGSEARDGGQDTESVTGEHDDVGWLSVGDTRDLGVLNVFDGVGTSGVFRNGHIVVVGHSVGRVVDDVLQNRAKLDGTENLGFLIQSARVTVALLCKTYLVLGEVDGLCVTSTLDVENTSVGPDVLVVTDQQPVGVGTEGRLSGTAETKEQSDIALFFARL